MKPFRYLLIALTAVLLILTAPNASTVSAEETERDLFYNDKEQHLQISITYDHNDAEVKLITPNGRVITSEEDSDDITIFSNETGIYFIIQNAPAGQWRLRYDKGSNDNLTASVDKYEQPIWITELDITSVSENILSYEFMAEHPEGIYYQYTLSLTTDKNGGAAKSLVTGGARAGELIQGNIDLSHINSYEEYYLQLYVNYYKQDLEYFDVAYTASFSYRNPVSVEPISDYQVNIYPDLSYVILDWTDMLPYNAQLAYVSAKADGTEIFAQTFPSSEEVCMISYEGDTASLEFGISFQGSNGLISETKYKSISLQESANQFQLILPDQILTNSYQWPFDYKNADNQAIYLTVNDIEQELTLQGSGSKSLTLPSEQNDIEIFYTSPEGITYFYSKTAMVDTIPPMLSILDSLDNSSTSNSSVIIIGKTDSDTQLTINDIPITLGVSGTFSHSYDLVPGLNQIVITAKDEAGNITQYNAAVQRYESTSAFASNSSAGNAIRLPDALKYLPWILAFCVLLSAAILILILRRRAQRKSGTVQPVNKLPADKTKRLKRTILWLIIVDILSFLLGIAGLIYYFIRIRFENSEAYIRMAYRSIPEAYDYIVFTRHLKLIAIPALVFAIIILLIILIIRRTLSKRLQESTIQ